MAWHRAYEIDDGEQNRLYYAVCDKCSVHSDIASISQDDLLQALTKSGWGHLPVGDTKFLFCGKCCDELTRRALDELVNEAKTLLKAKQKD